MLPLTKAEKCIWIDFLDTRFRFRFLLWTSIVLHAKAYMPPLANAEKYHTDWLFRLVCKYHLLTKRCIRWLHIKTKLVSNCLLPLDSLDYSWWLSLLPKGWMDGSTWQHHLASLAYAIGLGWVDFFAYIHPKISYAYFHWFQFHTYFRLNSKHS